MEEDPFDIQYDSLKLIINSLREDIKTQLEMNDIKEAIRKQILLEKCCLWLTGDLLYPVEKNFEGLI